MATLRDPKTGKEIDVGQGTGNYFSPGGTYGKDEVQDLLDQGYVPNSETSFNTLVGNGYNIDPSQNQHVNPYATDISDATEAADNIMSGYRDFGEGNDLLNREYGADNPYMDAAMSNIGRLEDMSTMEGPTDYAKGLLDEQDFSKQMQGEDAQRGRSSDMATAYNRLADSGGLTSGTRERLETSGMEQGIMGRQRLGLQDAQARAGILAQDTGYKQDLASSIPEMYNPYAQGMETWNQNKALAREEYEQGKEGTRYSTIGNIYGQETT